MSKFIELGVLGGNLVLVLGSSLFIAGDVALVRSDQGVTFLKLGVELSSALNLLGDLVLSIFQSLASFSQSLLLRGELLLQILQLLTRIRRVRRFERSKLLDQLIPPSLQCLALLSL